MSIYVWLRQILVGFSTPLLAPAPPVCGAAALHSGKAVDIATWQTPMKRKTTTASDNVFPDPAELVVEQLLEYVRRLRAINLSLVRT